MNKRLLLLIFAGFMSFAFAETMNFTINYLGVSVAELTFIKSSDQLSVKAISTGITNFLSDNIDNQYIINYRDSFLPETYIKKINQTKFKENSITQYMVNSTEAIYKNHLNDTNIRYQTNKNTRDFFSAMYFLRGTNLTQKGSIYLDANRIPWRTDYQFIDYETLNTPLGKKRTCKIKLSFSKLSNQQRIKSDILTNNLVKEGNYLYFWITDDKQRIPVKAEYTSSPFSVTWVLTNYKS